MVVTQQSKLRSDPFGQWSPYGRHEAEADPGEWLPVSQPNAAPPLQGVPKEYGLRAVTAQGYGSRESLLSEKSLLGENSDWTPHQTVALLSTHRSAPTFRPRSAPAHRPAPLFLLKSASTASVGAPSRPLSAAAPSGGGSASGLASVGDSGAALAASFTLASSIEIAGDSATASRLRPPRPQSASVMGGTRPSRTELWAAKKAAKESLQSSVTQSRTEHWATQRATDMKERRKVLTDRHPQDGEAHSESMPQDRVSRWHGSTEARTHPDPLLATTQRENVQRQSTELFMAHKIEEMSAQIVRLDATIRSRNECIATLTRELATTRHALQVANSRVWQPGENWQPGKYAGTTTSSGVVKGVGGSDEAQPVRVCRVNISVRR